MPSARFAGDKRGHQTAGAGNLGGDLQRRHCQHLIADTVGGRLPDIVFHLDHRNHRLQHSADFTVPGVVARLREGVGYLRGVQGGHLP